MGRRVRVKPEEPQTGDKSGRKAVLLLEDGTLFEGEGFGAAGTTAGEVVFNTGMTGYQEILTDPSYKGQMVILTYPHIGNYGINPEDAESLKPQVEGLIVRELCREPSNHRSRLSLDAYLKEHGICAIQGIDTRALTRCIREKGSMMGMLSTEELSLEELGRRLGEHPGMEGRDFVRYVTIGEEKLWKPAADRVWYYEKPDSPDPGRFHLVAFDFGIKVSILKLLTSYGMDVTVVPASTTAERVREIHPDGIFLSNGPGDPQGVPYAIETTAELAGSYPFFGICLGHQILGLAFGARTYKLKYGHHGSNHPVKFLENGNIEITAQNHNFAVDPDSVKGTGLVITHTNLNDGTVEGMRHIDLPVFSVQYHPEASPGPHDSQYLFVRFYRMISEFKKERQVSRMV